MLKLSVASVRPSQWHKHCNLSREPLMAHTTSWQSEFAMLNYATMCS